MQQLVFGEFLGVEGDDVHRAHKCAGAIHGGGWAIDHLNRLDVGQRILSGEISPV